MVKKTNGKVIGVISFKGGVGKTTSSVNIASTLSSLNKKVLVLDSNFSSPNLHVYMGLINPEVTLREVLEDDEDLEKAIYEHNSGLHLMPCHFHHKINSKKFGRKINELRKSYDFIIIDSSPSLSEELIAVLMVADELIIVTTPDYPTLLPTLRAAEIAKNKNLGVRGIILNKKRNKSFEITKRDIEETTGLPVIASISDDSKFLEASSKFTPFVHHAPNNKNSRQYKKIALSISGNENNQEEMVSFLDKIKNIFKRTN